MSDTVPTSASKGERDEKNESVADADAVTVEDTKVINDAYATIMATQKPNPFGSGYIKLYLICGFCFLNSTMNGFDGSLMGSINALPSFTNYFGLPADGSASTGLIFSIFQIGQMVAALFVWIADWQGRRKLIFIGAIGVAIGTVVTSTAKSVGAFIAGRFLLSFFATLACSASPMYLVEVAPPRYRATIAGMYNTFYYCVGACSLGIHATPLTYGKGSILATSTVYGTHKHFADDNTAEWRIPLWIQMCCPGIVALLIFFFPESPRWQVFSS